MIFALRDTIDEVSPVYFARVAIEAEFAHDGVGNEGEVAGLHGGRKQEVETASEGASAAALFGGGDFVFAACCEKALDTFAVAGFVGKEIAVGKLREAFFAAADAKEGFDAVVEWREVFVFDRPVFTEAVVIFALEFVVAQTP